MLKGFYILPSELFDNVTRNASQNQNLNESLEAVFSNIENSAKGSDSENDLKGLFDDLDVNSGKLGNTVIKRNQKLSKLLESIGGLRFGDYADNSIDAFGDAYEFLMTMYASNAGKSGGEFFTPQEVSELLAEITTIGKKEVNKVYDPACGSGSLLDPKYWDDEPFDAIVSNPPYSINWEGDANLLLINDPRISPAGLLAPKSKADLAFTMHMLSWLSTSGTAAIVEFPGVLCRGGAEQKIRKIPD